MPTENRRIATYLPKEILDRFTAFKSERGIKGDSQALIAILSEFFGVSQNIAHISQKVAHSSNFVDISRFEELLSKVEALEKGEKQSEASGSNSKLLGIKSSLNQLESRLLRLESILVSKDSTLSTVELAKRLGINSSTLSHWKGSDPKRGKSPNELLQATREKDPDGVGWILIPETNRFKPEKALQSGSKNVQQGELLSTSANSLAQVNPLPEGSERSGEG